MVNLNTRFKFKYFNMDISHKINLIILHVYNAFNRAYYWALSPFLHQQ